MLILTIRTDKPEAEIGLYQISNSDATVGAQTETSELAYQKWQAHRQLAETIHIKIETLLKSQHKNWQDIEGIVCFKGPGSFTGLRIGLSVANGLSYGLGVPIVGTKGNYWIRRGIKNLQKGESDQTVVPEYGSPVHITLPRR